MAKASAAPSLESSRAGTPAPGDGPSKPKPPTSATRMNSEGIETQQCKHCKKFVPRDGHPTHSKQCLREKKEKKKQKEAQAAAAQAEIDKQEAIANGTAGPAGDAEGDADVPLPEAEPIVAKPKLPTTAAEDTTRGSTPNSKAANDTDSIIGETTTTKTTLKKTGAPTANNKKRKADGTEAADKPPPKKKKTQPANGPSAAKPAAPAAAAAAAANANPGAAGNKPRVPVDIEKQCGVPLAAGGLCARSLTCKSHSMGAKRGVAGRSAPYDVLLAKYQKKNQAKMQRAAIAQLGVGEEEGGRVDSDEEREGVMGGVGRAAPRPLVGGAEGDVWRGCGVRGRYQHVRMKEMLSQALGGNRGGNLFAVPPAIGVGRDAVGEVEESGTGLGIGEGSRRQSMVGGRHGSVSAS